MGLFFNVKLDSLDDLLFLELTDLYDAEKRLCDALPDMAEAASSPTLTAIVSEAPGADPAAGVPLGADIRRPGQVGQSRDVRRDEGADQGGCRDRRGRRPSRRQGRRPDRRGPTRRTLRNRRLRLGPHVCRTSRPLQRGPPLANDARRRKRDRPTVDPVGRRARQRQGHSQRPRRPRGADGAGRGPCGNGGFAVARAGV